METETASEFPDRLDRVKFRTEGRKKIESEGRGLLLSPVQVQPRTVVLGIIADHNDAAALGGAGLTQEFQKFPEAFAVEPVSGIKPCRFRFLAAQLRFAMPRAAAGNMLHGRL